MRDDKGNRTAVAVTIGDVLLATALPPLAVAMSGGTRRQAEKAAGVGFLLGIFATPAMYALARAGREAGPGAARPARDVPRVPPPGDVAPTPRPRPTPPRPRRPPKPPVVAPRVPPPGDVAPTPAPAPEPPALIVPAVFEPDEGGGFAPPPAVVPPPGDVAPIPTPAPAPSGPEGYDPERARLLAIVLDRELRRLGTGDRNTRSRRQTGRTLAALEDFARAAFGDAYVEDQKSRTHTRTNPDGFVPYGGNIRGALIFYGIRNPPAPLVRPLETQTYVPPEGGRVLTVAALRRFGGVRVPPPGDV